MCFCFSYVPRSGVAGQFDNCVGYLRAYQTVSYQQSEGFDFSTSSQYLLYIVRGYVTTCWDYWQVPELYSYSPEDSQHPSLQIILIIIIIINLCNHTQRRKANKKVIQLKTDFYFYQIYMLKVKEYTYLTHISTSLHLTINFCLTQPSFHCRILLMEYNPCLHCCLLVPLFPSKWYMLSES